jgi:hypothetical protein
VVVRLAVVLTFLAGWLGPSIVGMRRVHAAEAQLAPAPRIELWTMGQGEDVFERFGHGALCVFDLPGGVPGDGEGGYCYNYGTTSFRDPWDLVHRFLDHRAKFWVSMASSERTLEEYAAEDRTIFVQPLPLTDEEARELAFRLANDTAPENRFYIYDHFLDNCTTRLRDHIDAVTHGALHTGEDVPYGPTWRDFVRRGFSAEPGLLALSELLLGRFMDGHPTRWQAMFHPDVLREVVGERFHVPPLVIAERGGPPVDGPPLRGRAFLVWLAILLAAVSGFLVAIGHRVTRAFGLALAALVLGVVALAVYLLAFYWKIVYLHGNEVALVLLPTDFALAFLRDRKLRIYLDVRLGLLALVALLSAAGALVSPLGPVIVFAGLPLLCLRTAAFGLGRLGRLGDRIYPLN